MSWLFDASSEVLELKRRFRTQVWTRDNCADILLKCAKRWGETYVTLLLSNMPRDFAILGWVYIFSMNVKNMCKQQNISFEDKDRVIMQPIVDRTLDGGWEWWGEQPPYAY